MMNAIYKYSNIISASILGLSFTYSMTYSVNTIVKFLREDADALLARAIEELSKHGVKGVEQAIPTLQAVIERAVPLKMGIMIFGLGGLSLGAGKLALEFYKENRKPLPPPSPPASPSRGMLPLHFSFLVGLISF